MAIAHVLAVATVIFVNSTLSRSNYNYKTNYLLSVFQYVLIHVSQLLSNTQYTNVSEHALLNDEKGLSRYEQGFVRRIALYDSQNVPQKAFVKNSCFKGIPRTFVVVLQLYQHISQLYRQLTVRFWLICQLLCASVPMFLPSPYGSCSKTPHTRVKVLQHQ